MAKEPAVIPRKMPRQDRSRNTVDAILTAAAQVFSQLGYAKGTTNKIANRAGVSIGSLYQYFPNKEAILVALMRRHIEEGYIVMAEILSELPDSFELTHDVLRKFIEALVALHMHAPRLHQVIFEEVPQLPTVLEAAQEVEDNYVAAVAEVLKGTPGIAVKSPTLAARLVVQVTETLTHWFVLKAHLNVTQEEFIEEVSTLIYAYLFYDKRQLTLPKPGLQENLSKS